MLLLAFVSNTWWNNYSWPSLPLSFISHCAIRPFYFTVMPPQIKGFFFFGFKAELSTSRQYAFLPVSDIVVADALVWSSRDNWCQAVFYLVQKALVAFCGVVTVLCGLRMSVHLGNGFNFKNNSEAWREALERPFSPSWSNPSDLCPWLPRALQHEAGNKDLAV